MPTFDVIVVGAGTAGCLLARRLVERTAARVLLIEAGPPYPAWALGAPLAGLRLRPAWSWALPSVPQPALGGRRVEYPMGRVVGGTSSVNAMIAAAGPPADYDAWAADCPGWGWADLAGALAGRPGEPVPTALPVAPPRHESAFSTAFLAACEQDGLRRVEPLDGSESGTCGRFALFQRSGMRVSAAEFAARSGRADRLVVRPRTEVRRVLIEDGRAVGVELGGRRATGQIRARLGVVLCAGALQSPRLLLGSGVGPARDLEAAGIPVVADLLGVGANLQDHYGAPVVVASRRPAPGRPSRWVPAAVRYAVRRDGVMASNCCEVGGFLGEPGGSPEVEIFALFQTRRAPGAVEVAALLLHPESRGTVALDPADPRGPPRIDPGFLTGAADRDRLRTAVAQIRGLIDRPALRAFGLGRELMPGDQDLDAFLRDRVDTFYHPAGTCRMGSDPAAVVDPGLRVREVAGLWVADNAILPTIPAGHTALTALLVGARAAERIGAQVDAELT